jgi:hypothetical protein
MGSEVFRTKDAELDIFIEVALKEVDVIPLGIAEGIE